MDPVEQLEQALRDYPHLVRVEEEFRVTMRVLAVLVERLQKLTGGHTVALSDAAVADGPDLEAWRDARTGMVLLRASR